MSLADIWIRKENKKWTSGSGRQNNSFILIHSDNSMHYSSYSMTHPELNAQFVVTFVLKILLSSVKSKGL